MTSMYILRTNDRPRIFWKISNGHVSGTDHPIRFMFGSTVGFSGRRIECDQIQDRGLQPSCIIFNGHIVSETVHPVQFVFGSRVKVYRRK